MKQIEAEVGPWRAALLGSLSSCTFHAAGTLRDSEPALDPPLGSERAVTVEVRRIAGGHSPWALLGASYLPAATGDLRYEVWHVGELGEHQAHTCTGLLGRPLKAGLPIEFAYATLDGLVRYHGAPIRPGQLSVTTGGYDDVDSSPYAFERAAGLLKWALLSRFVRPPSIRSVRDPFIRSNSLC